MDCFIAVQSALYKKRKNTLNHHHQPLNSAMLKLRYGLCDHTTVNSLAHHSVQLKPVQIQAWQEGTVCDVAVSTRSRVNNRIRLEWGAFYATNSNRTNNFDFLLRTSHTWLSPPANPGLSQSKSQVTICTSLTLFPERTGSVCLGHDKL